MKNNEIEKLINPYNKENKTYFSIKEEQLKKKKNNMTDDEKLLFETDLKNKNKAQRVTRKNKVKKQKKIKVKEEKTVVNNIFKLQEYSIFQRLFISTILILFSVIFASFIDSYNFKFVIFYNNGIDMSDAAAALFMYLFSASTIIYNGYCLIKSRKLIIKEDGTIIVKTYNGNVDSNVNSVIFEYFESKKTFNVRIADILVKKVKNKWLSKLREAIEQTTL